MNNLNEEEEDVVDILVQRNIQLLILKGSTILLPCEGPTWRGDLMSFIQITQYEPRFSFSFFGQSQMPPINLDMSSRVYLLVTVQCPVSSTQILSEFWPISAVQPAVGVERPWNHGTTLV